MSLYLKREKKICIKIQTKMKMGNIPRQSQQETLFCSWCHCYCLLMMFFDEINHWRTLKLSFENRNFLGFIFYLSQTPFRKPPKNFFKFQQHRLHFSKECTYIVNTIPSSYKWYITLLFQPKFSSPSQRSRNLLIAPRGLFLVKCARGVL